VARRIATRRWSIAVHCSRPAECDRGGTIEATIAAMTAYRPASRTGRYAVIGCKLKQNANDGCNSCASLAGLVLCFTACFVLLVVTPLTNENKNNNRLPDNVS